MFDEPSGAESKGGNRGFGGGTEIQQHLMRQAPDPQRQACARETKAEVVVAVVGVVVVAIGDPRVAGVVVPAAATVNPVGASSGSLESLSHIGPAETTDQALTQPEGVAVRGPAQH
jgi:hypothetical protein